MRSSVQQYFPNYILKVIYNASIKNDHHKLISKIVLKVIAERFYFYWRKLKESRLNGLFGLRERKGKYS